MSDGSASDLDRRYMRLACRLAVKAAGRTSPNPMVGAVLVRSGKVVGSGFHRMAGGDHAEIVALKTRRDEGPREPLFTLTWNPAVITGAPRLVRRH